MSNELAITNEQMVEMTRNLVLSVSGLANQMKEIMEDQRTFRMEQRDFRDKVDELLNSTQIQAHEKKRIHASVADKVNEIMNSFALHEGVRRIVYKGIWGRLNNRFDVTSYTEILRTDFKDALSFVRKFEVDDYLLDKIDAKMTEIQQMQF